MVRTAQACPVHAEYYQATAVGSKCLENARLGTMNDSMPTVHTETTMKDKGALEPEPGEELEPEAAHTGGSEDEAHAGEPGEVMSEAATSSLASRCALSTRAFRSADTSGNIIQLESCQGTHAVQFPRRYSRTNFQELG